MTAEHLDEMMTTDRFILISDISVIMFISGSGSRGEIFCGVREMWVE